MNGAQQKHLPLKSWLIANFHELTQQLLSIYHYWNQLHLQDHYFSQKKKQLSACIQLHTFQNTHITHECLVQWTWITVAQMHLGDDTKLMHKLKENTETQWWSPSAVKDSELPGWHEIPKELTSQKHFQHECVLGVSVVNQALLWWHDMQFLWFWQLYRVKGNKITSLHNNKVDTDKSTRTTTCKKVRLPEWSEHPSSNHDKINWISIENYKPEFNEYSTLTFWEIHNEYNRVGPSTAWW